MTRPQTENRAGAAKFAERALAVLETADPAGKARAALAAAAGPAADDPAPDRWPLPPDRPARPAKPLLAAPGAVPRRRLGSQAGRIALLHAVAHIEFNAIDLAFDMALRFSRDIADAGLDWRDFAAVWAKVGADEARHFGMIADRLAELGAPMAIWSPMTASGRRRQRRRTTRSPGSRSRRWSLRRAA